MPSLEGKVAIVQGVGYDQPSFSHFSSISFWHTASPNSGNEYGWIGRTASSLDGGANGERTSASSAAAAAPVAGGVAPARGGMTTAAGGSGWRSATAR